LLGSPNALLLSSFYDDDGKPHAVTSNGNGEKLSGGSEHKWEGGTWVGWWKGRGYVGGVSRLEG